MNKYLGLDKRGNVAYKHMRETFTNKMIKEQEKAVSDEKRSRNSSLKKKFNLSIGNGSNEEPEID